MVGTRQEREFTTPPNYLPLRNKRSREDFETDRLEDFKQEMKEMFPSLMQAQQNELKKINPTLVEIKKTNENIESTMSFLAEQNEEFRKKIEQLECQNKKDSEYITILEDRISQKKNFEIKNVPQMQPKETKENLLSMVMNLSKSIECEITERDISDIYRVKGKKEGMSNAPIVVEISSTRLKASFLKQCQAHNAKKKNEEKLRTKHLGFKTNGNIPVFISEQLTPKGARLFFLARGIAKDKAYKFCWTSFGRVYLRKTDISPIILIKNETQAHKLLNET